MLFALQETIWFSNRRKYLFILFIPSLVIYLSPIPGHIFAENQNSAVHSRLSQVLLQVNFALL